MAENDSPAFKVANTFFQNRIIHIQINNRTDFLKMFHCILTENSTSSRGDDTFGYVYLAVDAILNINKLFDTFLFNDLP